MSDTTNKTSEKVFTYRKEGWTLTNPFYSSYGSEKWTDTFTGVTNPNWRARVRDVLSATTGATGFRRQVWCSQGSGEVSWYTLPNLNPASKKVNRLTAHVMNVVSMGSNTIVSAPSATTAQNAAIAKLYARLNALESSASVGEDLGEISQTTRMLRSPLKPARSLMTRLLEGHQKALTTRTLGRAVKALADTALEYRFGIKPLVNSLADGMVGLQNRDYIAHYHHFSAHDMDQKAGTRSVIDSVNDRAIDVQITRVKEQQVRYKGVWGVRADLNKRSVNDVLSLRWKDVVPTIWNLIPYSFLVDYFTNVGDIFQSTSVPWSGVRWCVRTIREVDTVNCTATGWRPISGAYSEVKSLSPSVGGYVETTFTRSVQGELPRPSFQFSLDTSRTHWENIAFLVASRVSILAKLTKKASARLPGLESAFAGEVGRRGLKVPYPFHHRP